MQGAAAAVAPSALVLGRYRPLRPLGSGGSGSVWLAHDERSGVEVALKIVAREGKAGTRAEREAGAAARLRHPRCLRAYALARDAGHVYIAYEYVPGRTLRDVIRGGGLSDAAAVEASAQILDALAHAHGRGIVHRDVKPSNVLVEECEGVSIRLLDFGLALIQEEETLTAPGDVPGTLAFISPERLRGEPATPAADVWAVGVILWEALAGEHPFWAPALLDTARKIEAGPPSLATRRPDLPRPLVALVDSALSVDPARRPSAAKLADGLRRPRPERRRAPLPRPRLEPLLGAAPAAVFAGWTAQALPFYPAAAAPALAALAGALALVRPRAGLAAALAVPVLPIGNVSSGAAVLYAVLAAGWLALSWRDPRRGLLPVVGPLLGAVWALGLLPLLAQTVPGRLRRAVYVAAAVLLAGLVAGLRRAPLPFGGDTVLGLGIAGSERPLAVATALGRALQAHPALALEAAVLAAAALLLPAARRLGPWGIAGFGALLLAGTVLPAPGAAAWPFVAAAWATCAALVLRTRS